MNLLVIVFIILLIWFLDAFLIAISSDATSLFISCLPFLVSFFLISKLFSFLSNNSIIAELLKISSLIISIIILVKWLMLLTSS